jgi:quercetin dioxygenase-like cupin family protein
MTRLGSFDGLPADEPYLGLQRRAFDGDGATVTEYRFEPGARFPVHKHAQEQITLIADGDVEMTIAGEASQLRAGDWSVVEPEVEHGITAGPRGARILAIVVPRRSGPDAITVVE